MTRLLVSAALAALVAGCGRPMQVADVEPDTLELYETTRVIREVHEVPVYYVDTVYYEEGPAPAETVFVVEEYEYESETYIFVSEPGRPHPRRHRPRWSPGLPGPPASDPRERNQPPDNPDPEPQQPPRGRREPDPRPEPTPPAETVAEETQPRVEPGRVFVPVLVVEEELPVRPAPPKEPVAPVSFVLAGPSAQTRAERPAPRPNAEVEAPGCQSENNGPSADQPAVRGQRPSAESEEPEAEAGQAEDSDQLADN